MNPRVSRSSALASKATGFPIAKIAALLAVGYRLEEIRNDITRETPAAFEPTLDYVVVKVPRFAFEKFPEADPALGSTMKSVGEVMAIGRTFSEALGKAWRGIEKTALGVGLARRAAAPAALDALAVRRARTACTGSSAALAAGHGVDEVAAASAVDPWFVDQIAQIVEEAAAVARPAALDARAPSDLRAAKRAGLSRRARSPRSPARPRPPSAGTARRSASSPVFKTVDTCARGVPRAHAVPLLHLRGGDGGRARRAAPRRDPGRRAEPDRPGDRVRLRLRACRVRARGGGVRVRDARTRTPRPSPPTTTRRRGSTSSPWPPRTSSPSADGRPGRRDRAVRRTDAAAPRAHPAGGGVRDPRAPRPTRSTSRRTGGSSPRCSPSSTIPAPPHGEARTIAEAREVASRIGYPVVVRPSYVLGGRAMEIVYDDDELERFVRSAAEASPDHPVLIDRFLEGAIEVDVDAVVRRRGDVFIGAVMEHIEEAGVHSGDSSCQIPPATLSDDELDTIEDIARRLGRRLGVVGLLNLQLAVKDERIWVLEANPRASRTVPFVSKVIGVSLARVATLVLTGTTLEDLRGRGVLPADTAPLPAPALHEREGGGAPLRALRGRRHDPRTGDAVDRRGDGDRRRQRHGARQGDGRGRARAAASGDGLRARWRTATSGRSSSPRSASPTSGSDSWPPAERQASSSAPGSRWSGSRR